MLFRSFYWNRTGTNYQVASDCGRVPLAFELRARRRLGTRPELTTSPETLLLLSPTKRRLPTSSQLTGRFALIESNSRVATNPAFSGSFSSHKCEKADTDDQQADLRALGGNGHGKLVRLESFDGELSSE